MYVLYSTNSSIKLQACNYSRYIVVKCNETRRL